MRDVVEVKDLGSGVIGGKECDHFAFRAKELDWQIWIAQGDRPYPCRYVITTTKVDMAPQYTLTVSDWKAGMRSRWTISLSRLPKVPRSWRLKN